MSRGHMGGNMIKTMTLASALAVSLIALPALAQTAGDAPAPAAAMPAPGINIIPCRTHDADQEKADAALRDKAFLLMQAHDTASLTRLLPDLEAALARAPDLAPALERCGDKVNVYTDNLTVYMVEAVEVTKQKLPGVSGTVMYPVAPYARIAWEIGWIYYEQKNLPKALTAFEKGMRNDPRDPVLAGEYANALEQSGQNQKALTFVDTFLADNPLLEARPHATMLRRRGYALGELGQYDEAIAAYTESLKYLPDNAMALNEITYNKQQKALHGK